MALGSFLLPNYCVIATNQENLSPNQCNICLDTIEEEVSFLLPCGHSEFHRVCIERWTLEVPSCPICRTSSRFEPEVSDASSAAAPNVPLSSDDIFLSFLRSNNTVRQSFLRPFYANGPERGIETTHSPRNVQSESPNPFSAASAPFSSAFSSDDRFLSFLRSSNAARQSYLTSSYANGPHADILRDMTI